MRRRAQAARIAGLDEMLQAGHRLGELMGQHHLEEGSEQSAEQTERRLELGDGADNGHPAGIDETDAPTGGLHPFGAFDAGGESIAFMPLGDTLADGGRKVFAAIRKSVKELRRVGAGDTGVDDSIDALVDVASTLAARAIDEAISQAGHPKMVAKAELKFDKALRLQARGRFGKAIRAFKKAWQKARKSVRVGVASEDTDRSPSEFWFSR